MTWADVEAFEEMIKLLEEKTLEPSLLEVAVLALLKKAVQDFYDELGD